jgi:hypothetical protein
MVFNLSKCAIRAVGHTCQAFRQLMVIAPAAMFVTFVVCTEFIKSDNENMQRITSEKAAEAVCVSQAVGTR